MSLTINLTVNGNTQSATAEPSTSLLDFLRDTLNYKGTKLCCNTGECGACTIIYNGKPINSFVRNSCGGRERRGNRHHRRIGGR
jgi:carbon-monoxide dehydrogenase small subunit